MEPVTNDLLAWGLVKESILSSHEAVTPLGIPELRDICKNPQPLATAVQPTMKSQYMGGYQRHLIDTSGI